MHSVSGIHGYTHGITRQAIVNINNSPLSSSVRILHIAFPSCLRPQLLIWLFAAQRPTPVYSLGQLGAQAPLFSHSSICENTFLQGFLLKHCGVIG